MASFASTTIPVPSTKAELVTLEGVQQHLQEANYNLMAAEADDADDADGDSIAWNTDEEEYFLDCKIEYIESLRVRIDKWERRLEIYSNSDVDADLVRVTLCEQAIDNLKEGMEKTKKDYVTDKHKLDKRKQTKSEGAEHEQTLTEKTTSNSTTWEEYV